MFNVETKLEWCLVTDKHIHQPQWASHQRISLKLERSDVYALQRAFILYAQYLEDVVVAGQFQLTVTPVHKNAKNTSGYHPETSAPKMLFTGVRMFLQRSTGTFVMQTWEDGEWGNVVAEFIIEQIQGEVIQANRYLLGHIALPCDLFRENHPATAVNRVNRRVSISTRSFLDTIPFTTKNNQTTVVLRTHQGPLENAPLPSLHMYVRYAFEDSAIWWPTKDLSGGEILKFNDISLF